jgi:Uncharacterized conserved protein
LFGLDAAPEELPPRYNIAPSQLVAVVRRTEKANWELAMLRWGLVPRWAKAPDSGYRMINAKAETLAERPAFRAAFRLRRCLIPASGFFEWKREDTRKQPYYIRRKNGEPFAFAGLWEHWTGKDGDIIESCTIITTAANAYLRLLHDRMPVILAPDAHALWLNPSLHDPADLEPLLRPCHPDEITAYPVGLRVNSPKNDTPDLIDPLERAR